MMHSRVRDHLSLALENRRQWTEWSDRGLATGGPANLAIGGVEPV